MLICNYSDPPLTDKERQDLEAKKQAGLSYAEPVVNLDITNYITKYSWSGDSEQAARKLEFEIAYTNPEKDATFVNLNLQLGGFIYLYHVPDDVEIAAIEASKIEIFEGRIFYRKRNSNSFTFSFTAYDDLIYLAKSKIQMLFDNVTVTNGIKQICAEIGIPVSAAIPEIPTVVNYIANEKSCTEVFREFFRLTKADTKNFTGGADYTVICIGGEVTVIKKGTVIDDYVATDVTNMESSEHSESIETMINRVKSVDDNGTICQVFTNNEDVIHYGLIQDVFKMQPPKKGETIDNVLLAKSRLRRIKDESSIKALGHIQCITGYTIEVQEEQLKGKFLIKSDTHQFEGNKHTMDLTLIYQPEVPDVPEIMQQDLAQPVFSSSKRGRKSKSGAGNGSMKVQQGLNAGWNAWGGAMMDNGRNGCAEAVGKIGSYYSTFLAQEAENGVVGVSKLVSDAQSAGIDVETYNGNNVEAGDVIVYGDEDHVVLADGNGGYYGNSTSRNHTVHGRDYTKMSGMKPTKVIKTSRG
ncbi:MAG: hypothetical protein SOY76_03015 [Veillonella caviae]|nr:hypothetical protein [Veillonella caviae]